MRKAQISTEFMAAIGISIIIFIIVLAITFNKGIELKKLKMQLEDKQECLKIANMITYSLITGNNYTIQTKKQIITNPQSRIISVAGTTCTIPLSAINQATLTNTITIEKKGASINVK